MFVMAFVAETIRPLVVSVVVVFSAGYTGVMGRGAVRGGGKVRTILRAQRWGAPEGET